LSTDLRIVTPANGLRWVKPMFTLFRIPFGRHETIPDRASVHTQKWLGGRDVSLPSPVKKETLRAVSVVKTHIENRIH